MKFFKRLWRKIRNLFSKKHNYPQPIRKRSYVIPNRLARHPLLANEDIVKSMFMKHVPVSRIAAFFHCKIPSVCGFAKRRGRYEIRDGKTSESVQKPLFD